MKLVDILARDLEQWPADAFALVQDADGFCCDLSESDFDSGYRCDSSGQWPGDACLYCESHELAEDHRTAVVKRDEWDASSQLRKTVLNCQTVGRIIRESPAAWSGEGLPPVGTVCEFAMHDGGDWEEVQVIAHHNGYAVIAIASTDGFNVDVAECHELRPIRTAEQIATEERKLQREQLASMIAGYDGFDDPRERDLKLADYLLDHGYRKQEQK